MYIYKAILKHGHSNFSLEILEYCKPSEILEREQYYIDLLKPEYNLLKTAGSRLGYTNLTESNLKNRLSQSNRIRIEVTDLESNTVIIYNSIREAAAAIGKYHQAITKFFVYKQTTPYLGRYLFRKVKEEKDGWCSGGPKSYILNKIEDTNYLALLLIGQRRSIISTQGFAKNYLASLMFHTRVKAASRIGPHHADVISVVVGSLLGDCYANRRSVEGTRLCYRQSDVHKDYLF